MRAHQILLSLLVFNTFSTLSAAPIASFDDIQRVTSDGSLNHSSLNQSSLIQAVEHALTEDEAMLSESERSEIHQALSQLTAVTLNDDRHAIKHHTDLLNSLTTEFAHRRMQKYL